MIDLIVRYDARYAIISFPCSDNDIKMELEKMKVNMQEKPSVFVWQVEEPEELGCLKDKFVDLDEITYEPINGIPQE